MKMFNWFKKKPIKLCVDCKWAKLSGCFSTCHAPSVKASDLTGIKNFYVSDEREYCGACKPQGQYWEARDEIRSNQNEGWHSYENRIPNLYAKGHKIEIKTRNEVRSVIYVNEIPEWLDMADLYWRDV
jgi:hypothetical protein